MYKKGMIIGPESGGSFKPELVPPIIPREAENSQPTIPLPTERGSERWSLGRGIAESAVVIAGYAVGCAAVALPLLMWLGHNRTSDVMLNYGILITVSSPFVMVLSGMILGSIAQEIYLKRYIDSR